MKVPKGLHEPTHRTTIVQFVSQKVGKPSRRKLTDTASSAAQEGAVLWPFGDSRLGMSLAVLQAQEYCGWRGAYRGNRVSGRNWNTAIAGHRDTFFRELKDIRRNDEMRLQTATGLLRYPGRLGQGGDSRGHQCFSVRHRIRAHARNLLFLQFFGAAPKRFVADAQRY